MSVLIVEKERIVHNLRVIREETGVPVIPVLSGDAMGLGGRETMALLAGAGVKLFAAARLEEAETLASALPAGASLLLLTPCGTEEGACRIVALGLVAAVGSYDSAVLLNGIAQRAGVRCRVHLLFDTGLGHCGFLPEEADRAVQAAKYLENLSVEGCFTELVDPAAGSRKRALSQLNRFNQCLAELRRAGIDPGLTHMAGSTAALRYPQLRLGAVRAGAGLLGRGSARKGLQKVGSFQTEIAEVRWLPAGHTVGAGGAFKAKKPVKIAVLPVGRLDGLFLEPAIDAFRLRDICRFRRRALALLIQRERLFCEIGGRRVPLLGKVGQTAAAADVSSLECRPGDFAVFDVNPAMVSAHVARRYV